MTNFIGESLNKDILIEDIKYKLTKAIQNAAADYNQQIYEGSKTSALGYCSNGNDRYLNNVYSTMSGSFPNPTTASVPGTNPTATTIVNAVKSFMELYARVQKVKITDSANYQSDVIVIAKLSSGYSTAAVTNVKNAVDSLASANNLTAGQPITAKKLNDFINGCQDKWKQYCATSVMVTKATSYCHSNHCSHSNHGSRGRR